MESRRFALIHMGLDEVYGLEFVAGEILRTGHALRWFDGDAPNIVEDIKSYAPDLACFSPLTTYIRAAVALSRRIKHALPECRTVFGGHHVTVVPSSIQTDGIDAVVTGPCYGAMEKLAAMPAPGTLLQGYHIPVEEMWAARREYFSDIPRVGGQFRKMLMSHFGCEYNCSYCATSHIRQVLGAEAYKKYRLTRRPVANVIDEAKVFLDFPTSEVDFCDDDILYGSGEIEEWLPEFAQGWKDEIGIPIHGHVTPRTVVNAAEKTLERLASLVTTVAMGIQAASPSSLKLLNRQFQTQEQVRKACQRLQALGIRVKVEMIIGLPVADPVADAIETILFAQEVAHGSFGTAFPLLLFPGTMLEKRCRELNVPLNEKCNYEFYEGIGSVQFDSLTEKRIRNLTKLAPLFIKYNVDEHWLRSLIEVDLNEQASRMVAECKLIESILFREGEEARVKAAAIAANAELHY